MSQPKRIALIGNMNNNFFAITRHLRDLGYDAHLFFSAGLGMEHFHPKADTYSLEYATYCHEVYWLKRGFEHVDEEKVKKMLTGFDFYIGQGDEAAVAYSCGFNMDVYYPYGSDVYKYAYFPQEYNLKAKLIAPLRKGKFKLTREQLKKGTINKYLRGVIVNAKNILAEYTNEDFEQKIKGLNYKGNYAHIAMPFIYLDEYEAMAKGQDADVHWSSVIKKIRQENDFILLYHGRQEWKVYYNEFTKKNMHHVIIGFANYVKKNPSTRAVLVMIEYGNDVEHSKELIKELGIDEYVYWLPKMFRKDLMFLINNVDVCCGEFGRSYLTFGTVVEAMQMKKPVIHYREDDLYADKYPYLYPLFNAREPEQIERAIATAVNDLDAVRKMGEEACDWVKKYFIQNPLNYLQNLIEKK